MPNNETIISLNEGESLTRLIFNDSNYAFPSGPAGKSDSLTADNHGKGFGYEEWLNSTVTFYEGYQYGYMQSAGDKNGQITYANGQKFDKVYLFTRYFPETGVHKDRYIGYIENLEVLPAEERERVSKALFKDCTEQYKADLTDKLVEFEKEDLPRRGEDFINVRFRRDSFKLLEKPLPLRKVLNFEGREHDWKRYQFSANAATFIVGGSPDLGELEVEDREFKAGGPSREDRFNKRAPYERTVSVQDPEAHRKIQLKLYDQLFRAHRKECVRWEFPCSSTGLRVDVATLVNGDLTFYEVKTHNSLRACIRAALGQLLEYSFFAESQRTKNLVVVSHYEQTENVRLYLENLSSQLKLNISYHRIPMEETEVLEEEIISSASAAK